MPERGQHPALRRRDTGPPRWPGDTRPPWVEGNRAALTHGTWAAAVEDTAKEIVGDLLGDEAERHPVAALIVATTFVRWLRASADIAERGVTVIGKDGEAKAHPLLGHISAWERSLLAALREFGATPAGEASLAKDRAEAVRTSVDLDAIRERGLRGIEARASAAVGESRTTRTDPPPDAA